MSNRQQQNLGPTDTSAKVGATAANTAAKTAGNFGSHRRIERGGSSLLIVLLAIFLIGTVVASFVLPHDQSRLLVDIMLALLATVGIVGLFFYAVGYLQIAGQSAKSDYTRQIADQFVEGLLVTRGDSTIVYANEAYIAWSGAQNLSDIRTVERLFAGGPDISEAIYRLAQAAREKKRASEELRLSPALLGGGELGWYRIRVRPLDRNSSSDLTLWCIADVTRERQRHERVFQELQHAIDFLDHAPAGFFSADASGRISYMNATLAAWLDYDLAQVGTGGLRLADLVAGDGTALLASVSGAPAATSTETFDVDLKRRNGQNLPVRLLHSIAFDAERKAETSRTLVLNRALGGDQGEDLHAAQVRFARFFNSTPMAIAAIGKNGEVIRSNSAFAKLLPAALDSALGGGARLVLNALGERERPLFARALEQAVANQGDISPIDASIKGPDSRSARLFLSPAEDADGAAALLYALDTTEQRNLQESFAQSQKMQAIGQLAGGVAHDFNNVLTAIIGFSDLLLAQHRPTDPSFPDIMQIKQNANRAAGLVRQLLAFSRRQTLRPEILQLGDVLSELRGGILSQFVGEKIELKVKQARDLWLVHADLNQFEQVIINLVVNARDAMTGGGQITMRTRNITLAECASFNEKSLVPADYVAVEVEDNGHGIPAEVREKIFEPFFTTKEVGKGTGLGLSMVYGIIKQTGGYVFCTSEPGKGALFRLFLPRYLPLPSDLVQKKEVPKPAHAADLSGHGTVLLVEDEEAVRAFGARALKSRGYSVIEAQSGIDALEVVASTSATIDLIVSDVVMPEMDGPTMLGELRRRGIKAKVIFVSGYAEEAFAKNLPEGEVFGFLAKPFSLKQLSEAVKNALG